MWTPRYQLDRSDLETETLSMLDLAIFDRSGCHTTENASTTDKATTLTFKFLGEGKNPDLFRKDKIKECNTLAARSRARFLAHVP